MIRINLLPFRLARKKENIRRQVSIFLLTIVMTLLALTYYSMTLDRKIQRKNAEIRSVKAQIELYKEKALRVTKLKKDLEILKKKLEVVAVLKSQRTEQLDLVKGLTDLIVEERMWISTVNSTDANVKIAGVAFDNPTIADFMSNLENTVMFGSVDLKRSRLQTFNEDVKLKSFELECTKKAKKIPVEENKGKNKGKK